jgi:hypothetical protein
MGRQDRPPASRREPGRARLVWYVIASVWAWLWSFILFTVLFVGVPEWLGFTPASAQDIEDGIIAAVLCSVLAGTAWLTVYALSAGHTAAPSPIYYRSPDMSAVAPARIWVEKRHRLPRPGSAARTPMRRLAEAEGALAELLRRLSELPGEPAEHVVEHAWHVAGDTAASLRSVAARVEAVELAAEHMSPHQRVALEEAAGSLLRHLDQGLDAYRGLIAAAGLLAANTPVESTDELVEATEKLAGLAEALRELSASEENRPPAP